VVEDLAAGGDAAGVDDRACARAQAHGLFLVAFGILQQAEERAVPQLSALLRALNLQDDAVARTTAPDVVQGRVDLADGKNLGLGTDPVAGSEVKHEPGLGRCRGHTSGHGLLRRQEVQGTQCDRARGQADDAQVALWLEDVQVVVPRQVG